MVYSMPYVRYEYPYGVSSFLFYFNIRRMESGRQKKKKQCRWESGPMDKACEGAGQSTRKLTGWRGKRLAKLRTNDDGIRQAESATTPFSIQGCKGGLWPSGQGREAATQAFRQHTTPSCDCRGGANGLLACDTKGVNDRRKKEMGKGRARLIGKRKTDRQLESRWQWVHSTDYVTCILPVRQAIGSSASGVCQWNRRRSMPGATAMGFGLVHKPARDSSEEERGVRKKETM